MIQRVASIAITAAICAGCGSTSQLQSNPLGSESAVVAVMSGDLMVGEATRFFASGATMSLRSPSQGVECTAEMSSREANRGRGELLCSDGTEGEFHYKKIDSSSGYGHGHTSSGFFTFTYGVKPEDSGKYLRLPVGRKIVRVGGTLALERS